MEQKTYDLDKLTKLIMDNMENGLTIETDRVKLETEQDSSFNIDKENNLFHYFKFRNGKVYLFYIKKLQDKNGNTLFENNYCNINHSVYEILNKVFGKKTANRYAKWQIAQNSTYDK
ncbi:MAG: hypothetical protein IJZ29_05615 [Clostridia bacterium]|nr:hypothetical protein [Clostridia bacterium]